MSIRVDYTVVEQTLLKRKQRKEVILLYPHEIFAAIRAAYFLSVNW